MCIRDSIRGGGAQSVELLTRRMNECAEKMQFEKAAQLRDRIKAISRFSESQKAVSYTHLARSLIEPRGLKYSSLTASFAASPREAL